MNFFYSLVYKYIGHWQDRLQIIKNIGWLFFDKFLRMLVGVFVSIWIARYLGPEQFGTLNFCLALLVVLMPFANFGLQDVIVRNLVNHPQNRMETLGTCMLLQLCSGVLAYIIIIAIILFLRAEDQTSIVIVAIFGTVLIFRASSFVIYWFEAQVLSKYPVLLQCAIFLAVSLVKVILILAKAPLISFALAIAIEALIIAITLPILFHWRGLNLLKLKVTIQYTRSLLKDCWPLILSGITIAIYMRIDQIMLGQMVGDSAVGIYSAAVQLSEVWYFIPVTIVASVFPAILKAKKRSSQQYYLRLQQLFDLMLWLAIVVALPVTFLSTFIITLLYNNDYAAAGSILTIHIWAAIFVFPATASNRWIVAENRAMLSLQRTISGAVINIILNLLLIPHFGILGAAWATVISQAIAGLFFDLFQTETRKIFIMKARSFNIFGVLSRNIPTKNNLKS